jgi:nitrogen fixation protein NifU and related proteins
MIDELYHKEMLRLAAEAHGAGRIANPDASVTVDNPLCGDRVSVDVMLKDGRIARLGHEAKACLLCQAAASVIGAAAAGASRDEVAAMAGAVEGFLKRGAPLPPNAWAGLEVFAPVKAHKSRHRCVLLPFEAVLAALDRAA